MRNRLVSYWSMCTTINRASFSSTRPSSRTDLGIEAIKRSQSNTKTLRGQANRIYIPEGACLGGDRRPDGSPLPNRRLQEVALHEQFGFPCGFIPGVGLGQRGRRRMEGVGPFKLNADLAAIAWTARCVFLAFDSDLATNAGVAAALENLAKVLREVGAEVLVVRLPPEPNGAKNGIDDFLVRHGPEALRPLVEAAIPADPPEVALVDAAKYTESGYTTSNGNTYSCVLARDQDTGELREEKRTKLANFTAKITGETVHDDGAEQTREFMLAIEQCGRPAVTAGCQSSGSRRSTGSCSSSARGISFRPAPPKRTTSSRHPGDERRGHPFSHGLHAYGLAGDRGTVVLPAWWRRGRPGLSRLSRWPG